MMITDEDKLVSEEIRQDCYHAFSDSYQGSSEFDIGTTQDLISAYRQRIESRCSLQFGEVIRRKEEALAALREENARLREEIGNDLSEALGEWASVDSVYCPESVQPLKRIQATIASARPAPAQEQGEESVAKTVAGAVHAYIHDSIDDFDGTSYSRWELEDVVSRAILARKPEVQEQVPPCPTCGKPAKMVVRSTYGCGDGNCDESINSWALPEWREHCALIARKPAEERADEEHRCLKCALPCPTDCPLDIETRLRSEG